MCVRIGLPGVATSASPARAGLLTENLSGLFGPTTTLGGVALGADTAFTLQAVSDTSLGFTVIPGLDVYAVTSLTLEMAGKGTFIGIPDIDTNIFLADLTLDPNEPFYQVGIVNSTISGGFGGAFATATPGFGAMSRHRRTCPISYSLLSRLLIKFRSQASRAAWSSTISAAAMAATLVVSVPEPVEHHHAGERAGCSGGVRTSTQGEHELSPRDRSEGSSPPLTT